MTNNLLATALVLASLWGTAAAAPPAPLTEAEANRAIQELGSTRFSTREEAAARLKSGGLAGVTPLLAATRSPQREVAIRATEVLSQLYATEEFPAAAIVEDAIFKLQGQPGTIGDVAEQAWVANTPAREQRIVAQLESLGARVQYRMDQSTDEPPVADDKPRPIQFIVISRKWTGGDVALKILERLSRRSEIQIYHVNGATVSDEAMEGVSDLGFSVDRRGAFLGISSGGANVLFAQREGCAVGLVTKGSPAEAAGLLPGDRIVQYGEHPVENFEDLITHLKSAEPGQKVEFGILRDGEVLKVPVELGNW